MQGEKRRQFVNSQKRFTSPKWFYHNWRSVLFSFGHLAIFYSVIWPIFVRSFGRSRRVSAAWRPRDRHPGRKMPPKMPFAQDHNNGLKTRRARLLLQGRGHPLPSVPETVLQGGTFCLLTHTGGGLLCRPVSLCPGNRPAKRHVSLAHSHERPFAFAWGRGIMHSPPPGTPPAWRRTSPARMSVFSSGILRSVSKYRNKGVFSCMCCFGSCGGNPSLCIVREAFESLFCSFVQKSANMFVCNFLDRK